MSTLIVGRGPWATLASGPAGPRDAKALADAGERQGYALLVEAGRIVAAGEVDAMEREHAQKASHKIDLGDRLVVPGFIDPHTHPVFAATREDEFEMRILGRSYADIAKAGGGIRNSARRLRGLNVDQLATGLEDRLDRFFLHGTTTIEAKSGYGLSTESELNSLRAIARVNERHRLEMVPTFLGAHEIPDEYQSDREEYIRILIEEMLPAVAAEKLAEACDVFCEAHVFSVEESRRILTRAIELGLKVKLHADEIEPLGGAELGAELGALSADHLVAITDEGIAKMKAAGTIPIFLPGTSLYLGLPKDAPGKKMLEAGLCPALATDFNPGSCPTRNLSFIMSLAAIKYGMTAAQALGACTWNAAHAIGRGTTHGALAPGYVADLTVLDLPNLNSLPYHMAENRVHTVIKAGQVVVRDAAIVPTS